MARRCARFGRDGVVGGRLAVVPAGYLAGNARLG
eukprot:ctg_2151.g560